VAKQLIIKEHLQKYPSCPNLLLRQLVDLKKLREQRQELQNQVNQLVVLRVEAQVFSPRVVLS